MPLNKYANWGIAPLAQPRPPGLGAILRNGLGALDITLQQGLPGKGGGVPVPAMPSDNGLRVVWTLGAVRDALMDQGNPDPDSTNEQIDERARSDAVEKTLAFLDQSYPRLLPAYQLQFRRLDQGPQGFDLERRERLAELLAFELEAMATIEDPPPVPVAAPPAARSNKRR
jgi:hypothetical protein